MSSCSSCRSDVPGNARFCPVCGSAVGGTDGATEAWSGTGDPSATPTQPTPVSASGSPRAPRSHLATDLPGDPRWPPGTLVAERYRIVGLLGRGGMGEVYRADDLTLEQSVALKFLPPAFARDADRVRRFYQEVRVARELSHPNVCRVYDVGETEGRLFLSMEFIDGEDLSSLLRRIGRLPQEKGVEIARQLCAGLAALHERGVIHRDLKPANIMLDGRGRVRLTDFGLAAVAVEVGVAEARAGTPAYMAPEQLRGERLDARSDLFALGLVLYEIFTGRRAFIAETPAELSRLYRDSTPKSPSTILPELDPAIERVISRCLEKDPAARPSSALVVAAALPGGDPLAAALAAGEIPSLEMVAAAGETGGIRPWVGGLCLLAVCAAIVVAGVLNVRGRLNGWDPMEKAPAVLADRARGILREMGHDDTVEDTASGFEARPEILKYLAANDTTASRWETLRDARPAAIDFWYRESPLQLIPWGHDLRLQDPPPLDAGMAEVRLDTRGRLTHLAIVPPQHTAGDADSVIAPDWFPLFRAAGLDPAAFTPATPVWTPPHYADARAAWTGRFPEDSSFAITVEAASFHGRPTYFSLSGPWTPEAEERPSEQSRTDRILEGVLVIGIFALLVGAFLWAIRNVRLGRGDRVGARRLTTAVMGLLLASWILGANHSPRPQEEVNYFLASLGSLLVAAGLLWSFYLALEPYVRKTWPDRIVGWSRVLTGRLSDPLVGRDILVGGVWFLANVLLQTLKLQLPAWKGMPPLVPHLGQAAAFGGTGAQLGTIASAAVNAMFLPMFLLLLLLALRALLRNVWLASAVFIGMFVLLGLGNPADRVGPAALSGIAGVATLVVLLRFGLLAFMVGRFFALLVDGFPITFDASAWYAGSSALAILVILAVTAYGLVIALAGKPIFRD